MAEIPEKIVRHYKISDLEMREDSVTVHALFDADVADFTAFDPTLNPTYAGAWQAAITAADAVDTDEHYRDLIQQKTELVNQAMGLCRKKYNDVKYFALKAFPGNAAVQKEFGFDNYNSARQSDTKLQEFMKTMHATAEKYKLTLTEVTIGYSQPQIDEILTLASQLDADNITQEVFKKEQLTNTQNRITKLNAVYAYRTQIAQAAKIIYEDNFAKYQQYLLPASGTDSSDYAITGIVQDSATNTPINNARISIPALGFETYTNSLGRYAIADNIPPATYTLLIQAIDYTDQEKTVTVLTPDDTIITNVALVHE